MEESQDAPEQKPTRARKILKLVCHILFHILFIAYTIWATVEYILYDKQSENCVPLESETAIENETDSGANQTITNTTVTEAPSEFEPAILCTMNWCDGYGFLVITFITFYILWIYYWVFKPFIGQKLYDNYIEPKIDSWMIFSRRTVISIIMLLLVVALVSVYLGFESIGNPRKMVGLCGPALFILLGVAISKDRTAIQWRVVVHGLLGQLIMGILCIRLAFGRNLFECAGHKVARFLQFADHGARFVYGDRICDDFVFAFAILAVIFFFSVVTSCLYYLGAMQFVLGAFGFLLQATVGTTVCESVNAVGNVFLGMSESPLMIRPYIEVLTLSELHTICVSGYSTVAGTVLGAYISFGASPAYLITASVMAAPGSLAFSKLYYPETEESKTTASNIQLEKSPDGTLLDAAASGAANGLMIVLGIVSNIIAFLAIVYFFNAVVEWMFELTGNDNITFIYLLTKLFIPLAYVMGVVKDDCEQIALVVAEKTVINEFIGYKHLGEMIDNRSIEHRSAGIATFALCGFANPGSLGILIAALSAMAPTRRSDITKVAVRAFLVGSIVSFTSASIAGILIQDEELAKINTRLLELEDTERVGHYYFNI